MKLVSFQSGKITQCGRLNGSEIEVFKQKTLMDVMETKDFTVASKVSLKDVKLLSPLPRPTTIRDGYAFRQHVEAGRKSRNLLMIPEYDLFPIFYFTNPMAVTGPGQVPIQKMHLDRLDYELEIAIVIGKKGRNIPASKADEFIFGYTIMNDWSARGIQAKEMTLNLGPHKGKDFATSLGPVLVTRDSLLKNGVLKATSRGERFHGTMKALVNGKKLSEGKVEDMHWTFAEIIERASYGATLYPGDVIGSGTVGTGCLLELNGSGITQNLWLQNGDEVKMEIDGIGTLENRLELVSEDFSENDI